jgi:hypothetical protein
VQSCANGTLDIGKTPAAFHPLFVQVQAAVDFDLQRVDAIARSSVDMNGVPAGIGRVPCDRESCARVRVFGGGGHVRERRKAKAIADHDIR